MLCHPFVIDGLACGHLQRRTAFLTPLAELPWAPSASHEEALALAERHALSGRGIGWADVHLLAAAALAEDAALWTRDKSLAAAAAALGLLHRVRPH